MAHEQSRHQAGVRATLTLALWRARTAWPLLFITEFALLAAVMLICFVPLFSAVNTTAGLRDILTSQPESSALQTSSDLGGLSSQSLTALQRQETALFQRQIGPYITSTALWSLNLSNIGMTAPRTLDQRAESLSISSSILEQTSSHLTLLKGRLAQPTLVHGELEIMLTPDTARHFNFDVGSNLTIQLPALPSQWNPASDQPSPPLIAGSMQARVVGLFHISSSSDPFWLSNNTDFLPEDLGVGRPMIYPILASHNALLSALDQLASQAHIQTLFTQARSASINHTVLLDTQHLTSDQIDALITHLTALQADIKNILSCGNTCSDQNAHLSPPYRISTTISGATLNGSNGPGSLEHYKNTLAVTRIPVTILTLQITALILFFITLITDLLIDRQADAISLLRSRGASASQIFSSFCTQSLLLSLLALLLAPPLSLLTTTLLLPHLLSPSEQNALNAITAHPLHTLLGTGWYALGTILAAILTISLSLQRATSTSILDSRRHSSRPLHPPLWQRLYLDVFSGIIALLGYGLTLYLNSTTGLLDLRTQTLVSGPLTLLSPIFFLLGCLLLFLRLFPLLLQWASLLSVRSRGAISMLALAHMARSPRHSLRTTLLLSLACAFCIFTFLFTSSQNTHSLLLANYEAGADFSGVLDPFSALDTAPSIIEKRFQSIPGVTSVSIGLRISGSSPNTTPSLPIELRAVDADSFAHIALWPQEASPQPLDALMAQLVAHRADVTRLNAVPVIIDEQASSKLHLHIGSKLTIDVSSPLNEITCEVVAEVQHIPTVHDSLNADNENDVPPPGGILADFQSVSTFYTLSNQGTDLIIPPLSANYVWLSTKDDPQSLATIRTALTTSGSPTDLLSMYDRRELIYQLYSDPLYLNLLSILTIGATTTLLLALVGGLLAIWLNARTRLTSFAILRALGTTSPQIARILTWEQLIIYITALALGLVLGALLSVTAIPELIFSSVPSSGNLSDLSNIEFYRLQHIFPVQVIIPPALSLMLIALVALCALGLWIMVRIVARPSLGSILRLNQD